MNDKSVIRQQLHLLLTAYGYNLYNNVARARADDQLVRQKACASLGSAGTEMTRLAAEYARLNIPPASREQPFPPADKMAQLRAIKGYADAMSILASKIQGMAVPTQDRVWAKFRDEQATLDYLLGYDYELITGADALYWYVKELTAAAWNEDAANQVRSLVQVVEQTMRDRERFLANPF